MKNTDNIDVSTQTMNGRRLLHKLQLLGFLNKVSKQNTYQTDQRHKHHREATTTLTFTDFSSHHLLLKFKQKNMGVEINETHLHPNKKALTIVYSTAVRKMIRTESCPYNGHLLNSANKEKRSFSNNSACTQLCFVLLTQKVLMDRVISIRSLI